MQFARAGVVPDCGNSGHLVALLFSANPDASSDSPPELLMEQ